MDFIAFRRAAKRLKNLRGAFELVERAEKEGRIELRAWLQLNGLSWARSCKPLLELPMFLARYPTFAGRDPNRDLRLIKYSNFELFDFAAKRDFDANLVDGILLVEALQYPESIMWLNERVDVATKIMAVPFDDRCWQVLGSVPRVCVASLDRIKCSEIMVRLVWRAVRKAIKETMYTEHMRREYYLANNGELLHALIRRLKLRVLPRWLIKMHRFTPSDLLSVGITPHY